MNYQEWLLRPESGRNAEAATVVMGWKLGTDFFGYETWQGAPGEGAYVADFRPCTDRNATDMLLAEVERRGTNAVLVFISAITKGLPAELHPYPMSGIMAIGRGPASLLTWAACEACKQEGGGVSKIRKLRRVVDDIAVALRDNECRPNEERAFLLNSDRAIVAAIIQREYGLAEEKDAQIERLTAKLEHAASYMVTARMDRPVYEKGDGSMLRGELEGHWQTEDWLIGLLELAEECHAIARSGTPTTAKPVPVERVEEMMAQVLQDHPGGLDYAEAGRYVWPKRWDALAALLKEE
jgi:hypothetical protein